MEEPKKRRSMRTGVRIDIPTSGEIQVYPVGKPKKMGKGEREKGFEKLIKDFPIQNVSLYEGVAVLRHEGST